MRALIGSSRIACLCVGLAVLWNVPLKAADDPAFQIGVETWISTGESSWEISFREFDPVLGSVPGRSRLEWEDLDSIIYRLHAEYRFTPWFRASVSYGFGDVDDGKNTDTDWYDLEDGTILFAKSVADTQGDITLFDLNTYFRLNEMVNLGRIPGEWDIVAGYQYYEEDLRDRNGTLVAFLDEPVDFPFAGLDSTYRFEWSAFRLGLRGRLPLAERIYARGALIGLFGVNFDGEAFWNLREDFRSTSPNFVQEASGGTGAEIKAALGYDFTPSFYGEIGFWWFHMKAKNGTDYTFFADGETGVASLDWVETTRYGLFAGLGGRF